MAEARYVPVPVTTLAEGVHRDRDLYILRESQDHPILFRSHSYPMQDRDWDELRQGGPTTLWILGSDDDSIDTTYQNDLSNILSDTQLPIEEKCAMVYSVAHTWMHQVYETGNAQYVLETSEKLLPSMMGVIFSDEAAAHNFITRASIDYALYSHSINVFLYGVALARRALNLTEEDALTRFGPGLLLHDIGKLEISESLWDREEPFEGDGWDEVQSHPRRGLELVRGFGTLTPESESIIVNHHERLDGSGYPDQKTADELDVPARIAAIADVFDTFSTHRHNSPRMTSFEALQAMRALAPRQLDQDLLNEFLYIFLHPDETRNGSTS